MGEFVWDMEKLKASLGRFKKIILCEENSTGCEGRRKDDKM